MANPSKVPVNGSTTPSVQIQDQITLALLQNGGIARIQSTFRQRLDEAGWSENLRAYVTSLFRSGECTTYFEAMEKVKARVRIEGRDEPDGQGDEPLLVTKEVVDGGVGAVKKEIEGVCEMKK